MSDAVEANCFTDMRKKAERLISYITRTSVRVIRWEEMKVLPRYAFECIIQNINWRILPSRVYQRCGPKNRDSLRAQRPVQSVLSSERARAPVSLALFCIINLRVSPSLFRPSLSSHFLSVSFQYIFPPSYPFSRSLFLSPCCSISQ